MTKIMSISSYKLKIALFLPVLLLVPIYYYFTSIDVYIIAGQSNARGYGKIKQLNKGEFEYENISFWNGESFEPLVIGETKINVYPSRFGPEVSFAKRLDGFLKKSYIIKFYADGTGLVPGYAKSGFYPCAENCVYAKMINHLKSAIKYLDQNQYRYNIKAFIWVHGEQDAKYIEAAKKYSSSFLQMFNSMKENINLTGTKIILTSALPHPSVVDRFPGRKIIQAEQIRLIDRLRDSGIESTLLDVSGISLLKRDHLHYDTAGQLWLGKELAENLKREF